MVYYLYHCGLPHKSQSTQTAFKMYSWVIKYNFAFNFVSCFQLFSSNLALPLSEISHTTPSVLKTPILPLPESVSSQSACGDTREVITKDRLNFLWLNTPLYLNMHSYFFSIQHLYPLHISNDLTNRIVKLSISWLKFLCHRTSVRIDIDNFVSWPLFLNIIFIWISKWI